jgi:general secretion pathway protein F
MELNMAVITSFLPTLEWWPRCWRLSPWWPADSLGSKQRSLLRILATAADGHLQAAPLVASLAAEHRGRYRAILLRLARRLESGMSLADALEQTPGALSDEGTLSVRFGSQSGILAESLTALLQERDFTEAQIRQRLIRLGGYLGGMFLAGALICTFLLINIIPLFKEIQHDFDATSPWAFRWLINVGQMLHSYGVFLFIGSCLLVLALWGRWPRRFARRTLSSRWLRQVFEWRSANLLRRLAVAAEAGRPLPGALSTLARYHYDGPFRQKLLFVRNEVEQGADLWASMARTRILSSSESRALASAEDQESRTWTMRRLAGQKQHRITQQVDLAVDLLQPMAILLMASFVLLAALAIFQSLVGLIETAGGMS